MKIKTNINKLTVQKLYSTYKWVQDIYKRLIRAKDDETIYMRIVDNCKANLYRGHFQKCSRFLDEYKLSFNVKTFDDIRFFEIFVDKDNELVKALRQFDLDEQGNFIVKKDTA